MEPRRRITNIQSKTIKKQTNAWREGTENTNEAAASDSPSTTFAQLFKSLKKSDDQIEVVALVDE